MSAVNVEPQRIHEKCIARSSMRARHSNDTALLGCPIVSWALKTRLVERGQMHAWDHRSSQAIHSSHTHTPHTHTQRETEREREREREREERERERELEQRERAGIMCKIAAILQDESNWLQSAVQRGRIKEQIRADQHDGSAAEQHAQAQICFGMGVFLGRRLHQSGSGF